MRVEKQPRMQTCVNSTAYEVLASTEYSDERMSEFPVISPKVHQKSWKKNKNELKWLKHIKAIKRGIV